MVSLMALWGLLAAAQASDEPYVHVARLIEFSLADDKGAWLDQNFNVNELMVRSTKDVPGDDEFKKIVGDGLKARFKLGTATTKAMTEAGSYKFLRLRTVNGRKMALFRLLMDGPFNYHEYLLEKSPQGTIQPVDVYVYLSGEYMSETLRRIFLSAAANEPGVVGKMVGNQNDYAKALPKLTTMGQLTQQGKGDQALKIYQGLPDVLKKDKFALILRLTAASQVSPKESMDALEALRKDFPGDPSIPLVSLDPLFLTKKYDEMIQAVDEIDKAVGGDPFLHTQRAMAYLEKGDFDKARAAAKKAVDEEKTSDEGYWTLVTISLREKNFRETLEWLDRIEKDLGVEIDDLTKIDTYAELVKSPEYAAWVKSRKK